MDTNIQPSPVRINRPMGTPIQEDIDQFIKHGYESRGHPRSTMKTRATHLKQFNGYLESVGIKDMAHVTLLVIDNYFAEYQKTHMKSTTNSGRRIMKVFMRWLVEYKEVTLRFPPESIRLVREPQPLPKALSHDIIRQVINETDCEQDKLLIALSYEAGLRISELMSLQVKDVQGTTIKVHGKGSYDRTVYVTKTVSEMIETQVKGMPLHDTLFHNDRCYVGEPMTVGTARLHIQRRFKAIAGIDMTPHQLRHSFAINLLKSGCNIVTIQRLLGHKDIVTTQKYLRITDSYIESEYAKYMK